MYLVCPECGSEDVRAEDYDFGMDRETGYCDRGTRGKCLSCHNNADISEFETIEQTDS